MDNGRGITLGKQGKTGAVEKVEVAQWRLETGTDTAWDVFEDFGIRHGNIAE